MFAQKNRWTRLLLLVTLSVTLCLTGTLHAGKGGKGKPPKDDPPPAELPSYTIELFGTAGGSFSETVDMNDLGDLLMRNDVCETFVAFHNSPAILLEALIRSEDLDKYSTSTSHPFSASAINNFGQLCSRVRDKVTGEVVGTARISLQFDEDGLPLLGQGVVEVVAPEGDIQATDINELGDIVGVSSAGPFIYTDVIGFQALSPAEWGGGDPVVNNFAEVATFVIHNVDEELKENRAVLYQPPSYELQELGVIKPLKQNYLRNESYAHGINDLGVVVGGATAGVNKGDFQFHAFRTTPDGLEDLGTLGGSRSSASSINVDGEIVGSSTDETESRSIPFLYSDSFGMVPLESLVTNLPEGVTLAPHIIWINNVGQICGTAVTIPGEESQAFLLTPTN